MTSLLLFLNLWAGLGKSFPEQLIFKLAIYLVNSSYQLLLYDQYGNRTIPPRIIVPSIIVPRTIASQDNCPRTIAPGTTAPQDNCPLDNYPPQIATLKIVPQIISAWTIGAETIAPQNNWVLICTTK